MSSEFAKKKSDILTGLFAAMDQIHEGVIAFQGAVDELQEFGSKLRAMSDHLQTRKATLDSSFDRMEFPRGVLPEKREASQNEET